MSQRLSRNKILGRWNNVFLSYTLGVQKAFIGTCPIESDIALNEIFLKQADKLESIEFLNELYF